jgi:hypothetical protein
MEKSGKKASKKTAKKTTGSQKAKPKAEKAQKGPADSEKDALKKKINDFINSDKFDSAFEALQVVIGKRDKEIAEKLKSKMEELKVEEFVDKLQKTVEEVEQKGKKIIQDLNEFFKK